MHFRCMGDIIRVVGGVGALSLIGNGSLKSLAKSWRMLVHQKLSPTFRDSKLSPDQAFLIAGIIEGYELDVAKIIVRDIHDRPVSTDTNMAFLWLLTWICLDMGVLRF